VPGVRKAKISYAKKEAYVTYDSGKCSVKDMDAALKKVGFRGKLKRSRGKRTQKR
jgi:copper chaperone CopZ